MFHRKRTEQRDAGRPIWPLVSLIAVLLGASGPAAAQPPDVDIRLTRIISGLSSPLALVSPEDGSGRLFVVEQGGAIRIWDGSQILPTPFLQKSVASGSERGLLGLAFDPDFASNRFFFIHYSAPGSGDSVVSRLRVSATDPNLAVASSEVVLLTQNQPFANHNGGHLAFGPDGFLYLGLGDGGGAGDPQNNAQDLGNLLGTVLRLAAPSDPADPSPQFTVPASNPFVGIAGRDEIWVYGLRNPWRFSFDRATGDLFIGDVGQDQIEEISLQPAASGGGENFGWRRMEGTSCFNPSSGCNDGTLTLPILEYTHAVGCSITGGFRYRGSAFPSLAGIYFFGDFCSGRIWGATPDGSGDWQMAELLDTALGIGSFGEDENGELYVLDVSGGTVDRIEADVAPPTGSCFFTADFNAGSDGFSFVADPQTPVFTSGSDTGGELRIDVGGVNNDDILDMLGLWRRGCTLAAAETATLTLQARLIQDSEYESDELSQVLVTVNGGDTVLATLVGDGNGGVDQDTGLTTFDVPLNLPAGNSTIALGCFNNKKTFNNETSVCIFDNVSVVPAAGPLLAADFNLGTDGFSFIDDVEDPLVTSGQRTASGGSGGSGGLEVSVGGVDNADVLDMVGAWSRSFSGSGSVVLTVDANLTIAADYESDEFGEVRVTVDSETFVISRLTGDGNGGAAQTTGFVTLSEILSLADGLHQVTLECFNNKKTFNNESTTCVFDNVRIE